MDKEFFDKIKESDPERLYEETKKISRSLGISENVLKRVIPSPVELNAKLNSLSFEQLESLASSLDEQTLSQIKEAINRKGE